MPVLSCLIVDDDELSRAVLEHYVERHAGLVLEGSCESAVDAVNFLQTKTVDIIFLDVEMPEMSGLELARTLRGPTGVILVTSKEEYAVDAFEADVVDYLVKPVEYARFLKAVERVQADVPADGFVFVKSGGKLVKVDLDDVEWIEAQGDYVLIHTSVREHLAHTTMKRLADLLPAPSFLRVHRSYIVRLDKIVDVAESTLVIGRKVIPIGASYRKALLLRLKTL